MMGNSCEFGEHQLLLAKGLLFAQVIPYRKNPFGVLYSDFCDHNLPQAKAFCITAFVCEWLFKLLTGATSLYFESRNSFLLLEAPSQICNHKSTFGSEF